MAFDPITTSKGTKLQLMNLKGKAYLPVNQRLVWFREVYPRGIINTEIVQHTPEHVVMKATVLAYDELTKQYTVLSTGYKQESATSFPDYLEKGETGAIGRALGASGFGTQFEPGFEEGERLADAPIERGTNGVSSGKNASGKSPVRAKGGQVAEPSAGAPAAAGIEANQSSAVSGATLNPPAAAPVDSTSKLPEAKNRKDVNTLLSSLSRSIAAKRILTVAEIKQHMQERYGSGDKEKLDDTQAGELLSYLDGVNNGTLAAASTTVN